MTTPTPITHVTRPKGTAPIIATLAQYDADAPKAWQDCKSYWPHRCQHLGGVVWHNGRCFIFEDEAVAEWLNSGVVVPF